MEFSTAVACDTNAALDAELAAKMTRYFVMNEETTTTRKEHDVFKNDIIMRLQMLREEYPLLDNAIPFPEDSELKIVEEEPEEEFVFKPPPRTFVRKGRENHP